MSYRDRGWMLEHYKHQGLTQRRIAEICDISQATVSTWLDKHDITKRSRSEANQMFDVGGSEGRTMSEEAKEKLRQKRLGKNNPNWKNGEWTDDSKDFRDTNKWETFSRNIKEERDWTCQNCGQRGGELHTHHARPISNGGNKWDNTFIVLCYECHQGEYEFWHSSSVEKQLERIA